MNLGYQLNIKTQITDVQLLNASVIKHSVVTKTNYKQNQYCKLGKGWC